MKKKKESNVIAFVTSSGRARSGKAEQIQFRTGPGPKQKGKVCRLNQHGSRIYIYFLYIPCYAASTPLFRVVTFRFPFDIPDFFSDVSIKRSNKKEQCNCIFLVGCHAASCYLAQLVPTFIFHCKLQDAKIMTRIFQFSHSGPLRE